MNTRYLISAVVLLSAIVGVAALAGATAAQETTQAANETASIEFNDQSINSTVTVAEATLPEGGFVVVYNESGNYVGSSQYLEAGTHQNVTVELEHEFTSGQVAIAQAYKDDGDQSYAVGNETAYVTETNATVGDTAYVSSGDFSRSTTTDSTTTDETATDGTATTNGTESGGAHDGTETTTPGFTAALAIVALAGAALLTRR